MIRRSTIVVVLFGILVAAIVGYNQLVKSQPPLEISVGVDPLAEDWIKQAAEDFNQTGTLVNNGTTRVHINVTSVVSDVKVWTGDSGWTLDRHPLMWVASSSASLQYIPTNLPYKLLQTSAARTPLVWGGFQSRVNIITKDDALPFDWAAVNAVLKAGRWANVGATDIEGNVNMAINLPETSMAGLAVLFSGAADLNATDTLSRSSISGAAYEAWLQPLSAAIPRNIAGSPADTMASQGTSRVDFALLPESQWLHSLTDLQRQEPVVLSYPAYQFILDFPVTLWDDANTPDIQRQAATAFGNYLVSAAAQQAVTNFGLRPANSEPDSTATVFSQALVSGIVLEPDFGTIVNTPARSEADTLLRALD